VTRPEAELVGRGYDAIADSFAVWAREIDGDPREEWTRELLDLLPERARIADLGCGAGIPSTKLLAERGHDVTGVDLSGEQLRRARGNVPEARFVQADLTELELPRESFEAVTAFYSLNHVPRELLGSVLTRFTSWLVPGGFFLGPLGAGDSEDWTGEWLGTEMFFSSWDENTNRHLIEAAGLTIVRDEVVTLHEPEGQARFHWVLARR
jgi:SAM-dependent methyltransferase